MQNVAEQKVAHDYATAQADYGGMYHDGDLLVVLFTGNLSQHEAALRVRLAQPDRVAVLPASRTQADLVAANERLQRLLMARDGDAPEVHGVGIGHDRSGFAIVVSVDPYSTEVARRIEVLAAPEPVVVRHRPRATFLTPPSAGTETAVGVQRLM